MKWIRAILPVLLILCLLAACTAAADPSSPSSQSAPQPPSSSESSSPSSEAPSVPQDPEPSEESSVSSQPESEPESEPEPEPEPEPQPTRAQQILAEMTAEEKICQLFIITPEQLTGETPVTAAGEKTREALLENPVGGLIYFSKNLVSRGQTEEMLRNTQSFAKYGLFLAVDEEGGPVSRLGDNPYMETTPFPAMGTLESDEEAYEAGLTIGSDLRSLGFNLDFAPVADVASEHGTSVIGSRSFSSDPETAAQRVKSCTEGFLESGILCTLKHFPGHGDTAEDSHYGLAVCDKTLEGLEACEFLPFISGIEAGAPVVMAGHIALPNAVQDMTPATLSPQIIGTLLREQLGFQGLVVTDSMQMMAITDNYTSGEAALLALEAGADLILIPEDFAQAKEYLLMKAQEGTLSSERIDESVLRILDAKLSFGILE